MVLQRGRVDGDVPRLCTRVGDVVEVTGDVGRTIDYRIGERLVEEMDGDVGDCVADVEGVKEGAMVDGYGPVSAFFRSEFGG